MAEDEAREDSKGFDVEQLLHPVRERNLRQLPSLLAGAVRLVWAAAKRQLVVNVLLQGVSSVALALQVLVGPQEASAGFAATAQACGVSRTRRIPVIAPVRASMQASMQASTN
jgi:hypothetical protein